DEGKYLPKTLHFRYVGKFPVATDTTENFSRKDWKGNIAFNTTTLRTDGRQTAWYPVMYDIANDKDHHRVRYDLEISCSYCTTLYINGSEPIKSKTGRFQSSTPVELSLFLGTYDYSNVGNTFILKSALNREEAEG